MKIPKCRKDVRSVLGFFNFYRRFFRDFARRTVNLTNLTKGKERFGWNDQAQRELEDLTSELIKIPSLTLPDMEKDFVLFTDSSDFALGAVLAQMDENGFPLPIAFASRKLIQAERNYSTTKKELLAVVWAITYFKCYLYNRKFTLYTDHAALTYALKLRDPTSRLARWLCVIADFQFETRFIKGKCNSVADFLSRFIEHKENSEINHMRNVVETNNQEILELTKGFKDEITGAELMDEGRGGNALDSDKAKAEENNQMPSLPNMVNAITRDPIAVNCVPENLIEELKEAQAVDKYCSKIKEMLDKGESIKPKYIKFIVEEGILKSSDTRKLPKDEEPRKRIILPLKMVPYIFSLTHESVMACHSGFFKTFGRIRKYYFWPGMYSQVKRLVESCEECLRFRGHKRGGIAPIQRMPVSDGPMDTVHVDLSGPYTQTEDGCRYILVFICSFSKWIEAYPMVNITSDDIAEQLAEFISRHGCPRVVISDRGSNLISNSISLVFEKLGIRRITTSSYRPNSNGKVERAHASIAASLAHLVSENHNDWDRKLKFALLALRSAIHSATNESPHFVMTGRDMRLPYNMFCEERRFYYNDVPTYCESLLPVLQQVFGNVKQNLEQAADKQENYQNKNAKIKDIKVGDLVLLRMPKVKEGLCKKFAKQNVGPFRVIKKISKVNYEIQSVENQLKKDVVHINRLSRMEEKPLFPFLDKEKDKTNESSPGGVANEDSREGGMVETEPTGSFHRRWDEMSADYGSAQTFNRDLRNSEPIENVAETSNEVSERDQITTGYKLRERKMVRYF